MKGDFLDMARHKVEICGVNTANIKVLSNEEMENIVNLYYIIIIVIEKLVNFY